MMPSRNWHNKVPANQQHGISMVGKLYCQLFLKQSDSTNVNTLWQCAISGPGAGCIRSQLFIRRKLQKAFCLASIHVKLQRQQGFMK